MRIRTHKPMRIIAILAAFAMVAAACEADDEPDATDDEEEAEEETEEAADPATGASEAPMLAELDLPPLEERLPAEPLVVEPTDRIGVYGGTWRTALLGPADTPWFSRTVGYEQLTRWDPTFSEPIPNIAAEWEANEDASQYTFTIREGIRWSDGEPFTAHDVVFWYEAFATNEALAPTPPGFIVSGGETAQVEALDDTTLQITFPGGPNGLLPSQLANGGPPAAVTKMPQHYLEQFHEDYNPDVDELVAEEGLDDWVQLFEQKAGIGTSNVAPELPTVNPWVMQDALDAGATVTFERNPYYWKVDPEGNQLPYIDRVVFELVEDTEVMLLNALNGEYDMHQRHIGDDVGNRAVAAENAEDGDYSLFEWVSAGNSQVLIALNLTHPDPNLREVFQTKEFRGALSHAINRQEIIDAVYARQGEPHQPAPLEGSQFYNEQLATQYLDFDVDLANDMLDEAGFDERDGDGYRLGPDGDRISFDIDVVAETQTWVDAIDLVAGYWQDVGIDARMDTMSRELMSERQANNEHDAMVWWGPADGFSVIFEPYWYFPSSTGGVAAAFAKAWAYWYEGDEQQGEEPPEAPRRQMELYDELTRTADVDEQIAKMQEILEIAAEEFYVMGTAPLPNGFGIVRNHFFNVPEEVVNSAPASAPAMTNPEQYFIEE